MKGILMAKKHNGNRFFEFIRRKVNYIFFEMSILKNCMLLIFILKVAYFLIFSFVIVDKFEGPISKKILKYFCMVFL